MKIIGVSGSPIADSNTDRAVKKALEAAGLETEFIKLSDYTVAPCRACLGCVKTNRCVQKDDGIMLTEKIKEADALIVGAYTPYSSIDGRTKVFLERLYPLRHNKGLMAGKPGGAIITSCVPPDNEALPPAGDMGVNAIMFYMMEEGMDFIGSAKVMGNVPCIKCGNGDTCRMSAVKMLYGNEATVAATKINIFEEQTEAVNTIIELGRKIGEAVMRMK